MNVVSKVEGRSPLSRWLLISLAAASRLDRVAMGMLPVGRE